jgi:hypothetical protein
MDGKSLLLDLAAVLDEDLDTSSFLDERSSYGFLFEAAKEFVRKTQALTATQSIATVASQAAYDANADYLSMYLKDSNNDYFLKLNDGSSDYFIRWRDYSGVIRANNTSSAAIPSNFSIVDKSSLTSAITGTATSAGALSNGECTLTDSSAPFANASIGDAVHNTTDGSHGYVIAKTSSSALVTALFGGTENDWDSSDAYVVVPQARKQIYFDPPLSTSGYTATFYYLQKPDPVYSPYRTYRFDNQYHLALVKYAAWLYKYKDRQPNFGDAFYKYWTDSIRQAARQENKSINRYSMRVNFNRRSYGDRSYR